MKNTEKIALMQKGGKKLRNILDILLHQVIVGKTGREIDILAEQLIREAGGSPSFKEVPNYDYTTCICTNDIIVHGIPTGTPFLKGDIVGLDIGMLYDGYHTDVSWSIIVGKERTSELDVEKLRFLNVGEKALYEAIGQAKVGNHIGHISKAIQNRIEGAGYSVVRSLVGHGIGRKLHEKPEVPGFLIGSIDQTPILTEGMTLAIEVIYTQGSHEVIYDKDGWTIRTKDHSLSGLFEQTIAIERDHALILT